MRGFPVLRLILVAAALGLLALPVWSLTGASRPSVPAPLANEVEPATTAPYRMLLTASAPAVIEASAANLPPAASVGLVKTLEANFTMSATQPEDLVVSARFGNAAGQAALRVVVEKDGQTVVDRTFWGSGVIEDVVEIPAK